MKKMTSKKGFTLIELLIVIAIIAVLAVAFLPTILGAPAKGRDTARIASLQKIQKVLISANLDNTVSAYPVLDSGGCVNDTNFANYKAAFGGTAPVDPSDHGFTAAGTTSAAGCAQAKNFFYKSKPSTSYVFGLYSVMENCSAANTTCAAAAGGTITPPTCGAGGTAAAELCYAILVQ